jgi:hypothetical protein
MRPSSNAPAVQARAAFRALSFPALVDFAAEALFALFVALGPASPPRRPSNLKTLLASVP